MVGWVNKDLFLFEPGAYRLAAWTTDLGPILDLYCDGHQLFVLCEGGGVRVVSFVSMETCIQWLVRLELQEQATQVLQSSLFVTLVNDNTICLHMQDNLCL